MNGKYPNIDYREFLYAMKHYISSGGLKHNNDGIFKVAQEIVQELK